MNESLFYSREEMLELDINTLKTRGVDVSDIASLAYKQTSKYNPNVDMEECVSSVKKILSLRDVFHIIQLGAEIDRLAEEGKFEGPIQEILMNDLGVFGIDEIFGLNIANLFGVIGQTNFGDLDVNKPGIIGVLNKEGAAGTNKCHTFMDDIVGAVAAAAATRISQISSENTALNK